MGILRHRPKETLIAIVISTELVGLIGIFIWIYDIHEHMGGNNWLDFGIAANHYHAILMPISMVFLLGNGLIIFRLNKSIDRETMKWLHMAVFLLSVLLATVGIYYGIVGRHAAKNTYFDTLHSWLGIFTYILFLIQIISGIVAFMCKVCKPTYRELYLATHAYFGVVVSFLSTLVICMGLLLKGKYYISNYPSFPISGMLLNISGMLFIIFNAATFYITVCPYFEWDKFPDLFDEPIA